MSIIRYFGTKGSVIGKLDPADDPRDAAFVPLDQRSALAQIRWWARKSRSRDERPQTGVFDRPVRK